MNGAQKMNEAQNGEDNSFKRTPHYLNRNRFKMHWEAFRLVVLTLAVVGFPHHLLGQIITANNPMIAGTGYHTYRIPGFAVAQDGSLLLFAEGRPTGADPGAAGDIHMVFKRSTDNGVTWSNLSVLRNDNGFDYSDSRVVVDQDTGKVHLQYVQWPTDKGQANVGAGLGDDSSVIFYQSSSDHGAKWSTPANINAQVKNESWYSLNTGPGKGIQLQWQDSATERNGRLIIPGHRRATSATFYNGVAIYSDDNGATWQRGSGVTPGFADESEVIELTNGDLLWDGRQQSGIGPRHRYLSTDGGDTWTSSPASGMPLTPVDTAMVRYSAKRSGDDRDRILYSSPLGTNLGTGNNRNNIGVWTSYDEGKTFINPVLIESGSAAYSVIDKLNNGTIGLVYEVGPTSIRYVNFGLQTLEGTGHRAELSHYDGFGNTVMRSNGGIGWSGGWTGNGNFTASNQGQFGGGSSIPFENFRFEKANGRLDLAGANRSVTRSLSQPIDLNSNSVAYVSVLISQALDTTSIDDSNEFLDILLMDDGGVTQAAFGVGSNEAFFVNQLGGVKNTAGELTLTRNNHYFLVAKIVSQDDSLGGNFDQIFLKVFTSGTDLIPDSDVGLDWTLVGTTSENNHALLTTIRIAGGANAFWSIDELRIGSTWGAVASAVPEPGVGLALGLASLALAGRRRRQ